MDEIDVELNDTVAMNEYVQPIESDGIMPHPQCSNCQNYQQEKISWRQQAHKYQRLYVGAALKLRDIGWVWDSDAGEYRKNN